MPLMDGRAFCRRVRDTPEWAQIPFIILSAYIEADGSHESLDAPADLFFSKQDSFSCLLSVIKGLISKKRG
jgi:CheY-like chemotaxis protein